MAMKGHLNTVKYLVEKAGADKDAKAGGYTAAEMAMQYNHPMVFAFLDPEAAEKKRKELLEKMNTARTVHVISTRYQKEESMMEQDKGKDPMEGSCDPFRSAHYAKYWLEHGTDGIVLVFPSSFEHHLFRCVG